MVTSKTLMRASFLVYFLGLSAFISSLLGDLPFPGLKWLAIAMILFPALEYSFWGVPQLSERKVLVSVLGGLLPLSYVYYIRFGYPVGFADVPVHMFQTQSLFTNSGTLDFSRAQSIPFSFVGLYVEGRVAEVLGGLDITAVALSIPPVVNLGTLLIAYAIVKRVSGARVAMIALILLGWENNTIVFGDEYRTQGIGTLCMLAALLLYLVQDQRGNESPWYSSAALLFLLALSTTAFVAAVFAFWCFAGVILTDYLIRRRRPLQNPSHFLIMSVFVLAYVFYVSASAGSVIGAFIALLRESLFSSSVSFTIGGQEIYGPVVRWFTYAFWGLAGLLAILLLKWGILRDTGRLVTILGGLGAVFIFATTVSVLLPFSAGRGYTLGALLVGIVVPAGFLRTQTIVDVRHHNKLRILACCVVVLFAVIAVAKLPVYVGGSTSPLRGHELIDDVPYWRVDPTDFAAARFIGQMGRNQTLYLHMLIAPYMILSLYNGGMQEPPPSLDSHGQIISGSLLPGSLVLLRDQVASGKYAYRTLLPPLEAYDQLTLVYSNGDYLLYEVPST